MADDLSKILREIEQAAAARSADHDMHPFDRATLHRLLDAFDDQYLIIASWFLRTAAGICIPPVEGTLITIEDPIPLPARWYTTLNNLIAGAPPSWFSQPEQRGALMKALAEQAAVTVSETR